MEIQDYLQVIRRHWRLIVATTLVGVTAGVLLATLSPARYEGRTQLFVSARGTGEATDLLQSTAFTEARVLSYARLITSPAVLGPVASEYRVAGGSSALANRVSASTPRDTLLINLAVTADSPRTAAELANAVAKSFVRVAERLDPPTTTGDLPVRIAVVSEAVPPTVPSAPNKRMIVLLFTMLGAIVGMGAALLRERLDTRIKSHEDIERLTDVPVIGLIANEPRGKVGRPLLVPGSKSLEAEAYRQLRTNLKFMSQGGEARRILVTSALPDEGKTTTAINLAISIREAGDSVVLVEADLRRPAISGSLGLATTVGLTTALVREVSTQDALVRYGGDNPLWVLPAGPIPPNPSELLGSGVMGDVLDVLQEQFTFVIVDSPPLLPVADAMVLARQTDGVLFVVSAGVKREPVRRSLDQLAGVGARVLGILMNRAPTRGVDATGYYARYTYDEAPVPSEPPRVEVS